MSFDSFEFRKNFPQLERKDEGKKLVYFDNGASTLKHSKVTERVNVFNRFQVANVHRGAHKISQEGTEFYEESRRKVQKFIGAKSEKEIIFTRGTTESINLIAHCLSQTSLGPEDEVLITSFEHHSNIVPWQMICERVGCKLRVVEFDKEKGFNFENFLSALNEKTKVFSFIWFSNSFGNRLPVEKLVEECQKRKIITVIDAAQTILTEKIDMKALGCDFLTFSGHKVFAPYGIGVLFGKQELLEKLPPYQGGGSMVDRVTFEKTSYVDIPQKFEAGTPNIAGAIGLGAAIDILDDIDFLSQHQHVLNLRSKLIHGLKEISGCEVYNFESTDYAGVVSFNMKGAHSSDVGSLLDKYGIAARTGHHCTQPLMGLMGIDGTVRISLAAYNTEEEIEYFIETMKKIKGFF